MTRLARHAKLLLVGYSLLLGLALFFPTSGRQSAMVTWLGSALSGLGAPVGVTDYARLEVLMNVLIVAPVTFLATCIRPSWSWRDWTAWGFVAAGVVEVAQGLLLPGRQAAFSDVVANTLGALLGALLGAVLTRRLAPRPVPDPQPRQG